MLPRRVVIAGGDAREWHAACTLHTRGWDVVYVGPRPPRGVRPLLDPPCRARLSEAVADGDVLAGPVRGFDPADEATVAALLAGGLRPALVVAGRPGRDLAGACRRAGVPLVDILARDDFALANAVPTAEGAIVEALLAAEDTLWGSRAVVVGYGRTGRVLAHRLRALGAETWVVARRAAARAEAAAAGCRAVDLSGLAEALAGAGFVFNTAPAPVLVGDALRACRPGTVVVDLASPPGGVDLDLAASLGLVTRWPLGIPGRCFPRAAGRILADALVCLLREQEADAARAAAARER